MDKLQTSEAATRWTSLLLVLVWVLSAAYFAVNLKRGWIPHDEGILSHAAERILRGEMPHRDFDDPYTGGLSYLNAAAFKTLGLNLLTLRIVLFSFFLFWVPAVFLAAREFSGPLASAVITLTSVAWSVPNYSAAVPSWFCLFFATFGTLAILRYLRNPRIEWLILAGLCGGLSCLIKTPGLYFVAGVLLFFIYSEQTNARKVSLRPRPCHSYFAFVVLVLAMFVTTLCKLVLTTGGWGEFLHFVYPALAIALFLVIRENLPCGVSSSARFRSLFALLLPFALAALLPLICFLAMYWYSGAIHQLIRGLFVYHLRRLSEAGWPAPSPVLLIPAILLVALLFQIAHMRGFLRGASCALLILLAALLVITSRHNFASYQIFFQSVRNMIPVITTAGLLALNARQKESTSLGFLDQQIMLLLCVTAMCSLIQFPFAYPLYFCYVAPLALLCAAALASRLDDPPRLALYAGSFAALLFAVFVLRPGFVGEIGFRYQPDLQTEPLALPRAGGLRVTRESADEYNVLIPFVSQLAAGQPILAGPDSPEIYFLTGSPNPTPVFFDFFHGPNEYREFMRGLLDRSPQIHVVVIKSRPQLSRYNREILESLVLSRFPYMRKFASFEVFWRQ